MEQANYMFKQRIPEHAHVHSKPINNFANACDCDHNMVGAQVNTTIPTNNMFFQAISRDMTSGINSTEGIQIGAGYTNSFPVMDPALLDNFYQTVQFQRSVKGYTGDTQYIQSSNGYLGQQMYMQSFRTPTENKKQYYHNQLTKMPEKYRTKLLPNSNITIPDSTNKSKMPQVSDIPNEFHSAMTRQQQASGFLGVDHYSVECSNHNINVIDNDSVHAFCIIDHTLLMYGTIAIDIRYNDNKISQNFDEETPSNVCDSNTSSVYDGDKQAKNKSPQVKCHLFLNQLKNTIINSHGKWLPGKDLISGAARGNLIRYEIDGNGNCEAQFLSSDVFVMTPTRNRSSIVVHLPFSCITIPGRYIVQYNAFIALQPL